MAPHVLQVPDVAAQRALVAPSEALQCAALERDELALPRAEPVQQAGGRLPVAPEQAQLLRVHRDPYFPGLRQLLAWPRQAPLPAITFQSVFSFL